MRLAEREQGAITERLSQKEVKKDEQRGICGGTDQAAEGERDRSAGGGLEGRLPLRGLAVCVRSSRGEMHTGEPAGQVFGGASHDQKQMSEFRREGQLRRLQMVSEKREGTDV